MIIGSDHRGFLLKQYIIANYHAVEFIDVGSFSEASVDFPDIVASMVDNWSKNSFGVLICGSGIGMSIAANKYKKMRAALCRDEEDVKQARMHNDANVLVLSANLLPQYALKLIDIFANTSFSKEEKYINRVKKIDDIIL
ncbi:MAG: RpiB/LacA/LacB family sugar-phosphate isomerase [Alphaproteobacteria bacterium]|nr:MAG: RpiB/LacA/LacB family sugar-phosphate isomerase [Alphaproteobacteria bacterium]